MKPFLLLATRAKDLPAEGEYRAFLQFGGLEPDQLVRHRLERDPLGHVDLDEWSGIILGGSPFTISDPQETKSAVQLRVESELADLIARVIERDTPFLGACYGVGVIGRYLGAVIDDTHGEPVGPTSVTLTAAGRADPLLGDLPDRFDAFVGHKEAITVLPPPIQSLAGSSACPVQAFRVGEHVYATQFHPELDVEGICMRIEAYKHYGYFEPDEAEALKADCRGSEVTHPARLLSRFVERYALH